MHRLRRRPASSSFLTCDWIAPTVTHANGGAVSRCVVRHARKSERVAGLKIDEVCRRTAPSAGQCGRRYRRRRRRVRRGPCRPPSRRRERYTPSTSNRVERLAGLKVREIFAWGKHLVFQIETFALRVHFMLWGTFAATVRGSFSNRRLPTKRSAAPRARLSERRNHDLGSVRRSSWKTRTPKAAYDFAADIMADEWDATGRASQRSERFHAAKSPTSCSIRPSSAGSATSSRTRCCSERASAHSPECAIYQTAKLRAIVADARTFSFRFLELRRVFSLRKNLEVYRRSTCPRCGGKYRAPRPRSTRAPQLLLSRRCQRCGSADLP